MIDCGQVFASNVLDTAYIQPELPGREDAVVQPMTTISDDPTSSPSIRMT
jgi:hypothetical protein